MENPKKIDNPQALEQAVESYFSLCESQGIFPDLAGMRLALGLSRKELDALGREASCRRVLEQAKDRRESWLVRRMISDNKAVSGCLNALKQPGNGGYMEKSPESSEKKLTIVLSRNLDEKDFK